MGELKWVANTYDPHREDWHDTVAVGFDETRDQAITRTREWLAGKTLGEPQATLRYTAKELKAMGLVGVYAA